MRRGVVIRTVINGLTFDGATAMQLAGRQVSASQLPAAPSCAPADDLFTNGITVRESSQQEFCNTIRSKAEIEKSVCQVRIDLKSTWIRWTIGKRFRAHPCWSVQDSQLVTTTVFVLFSRNSKPMAKARCSVLT